MATTRNKCCWRGENCCYGSSDVRIIISQSQDRRCSGIPCDKL